MDKIISASDICSDSNTEFKSFLISSSNYSIRGKTCEKYLQF